MYNGPDLGTLQGVQPEAERNAFMRLAKLVSVRPQSTTNDSPHSREKSTRARPYVARTVSVIRPGVRRAASGAYCLPTDSTTVKGSASLARSDTAHLRNRG